MFLRRFLLLCLFWHATFLIFNGRLTQLQVIEGKLHRAEALRNIVGERRLATTRGVIRDAHGKVLAANRPSYNVHVVPEQLDMKGTWNALVRMMGVTDVEAKELRDDVEKILKKGGNRAQQQTLIKMDVDRDVVAALETHRTELKGVRIVPAPVRSFPYGPLGAHMIGYMREVDADTLAENPDAGYRAGDRLGAV